MTFNLKKKKAQIVNVNDKGPIDSYLQMLMNELDAANAMPTEEALARLTDMNSLTLYGIDSFTDLKEMIEQQQEAKEMQEDMQNQMISQELPPGSPVVLTPAAKGNKKMIKPFNLKKAQFQNPAGAPVAMPGFSDTLTDPELVGDELEIREDIGGRKFKNGADVQQWLQNETDLNGALQFVTDNDTSENADLVKEMVEQFYDMTDDPVSNARDLEIVAGQIFDYLPESVKEGSEIPAIQKQFEDVHNTIKKIAQDSVNKNKKKTAFNLTKTAQHKSLDNAILWGPSQSRKVDPFLRQPVSDWHIVERNKGFGLVVDDIWNIDYETIWRENVMDKYSRPYKDKDGNWVGGYIQKRFEVDKNIPETTNMQLKPGQKRRPILPEYGNTESRLQDARSKGEIAGANNTTKPFNWKEASKKKS